MGTCPNCGHRKLFGLEILGCVVCGKKGCSYCIAPDFTCLLTLKPIPHAPGIEKQVYACSEKCASKFLKKALDSISLSETVGTNERYADKTSYGVLRLFEDACFLALKELNSQLVENLQERATRRGKTSVILREDKDRGISSSLYDDFSHNVALVVAGNLVNVGRPLDAAKIYENMKMYDKARELREMEKQVVVRRVDVSVDLNALLKQVGDGGIVVVYRCPHCSAPLKVGKDTKVESLRVCEHCGSEIEAVDVVDFLRTALS